MAGEFEYYSIFCGVFLYDEKLSGHEASWIPWLSRLKEDEGFVNHVRRTYYETYLHSIVPEVIIAPGFEDVHHYTQSDVAVGKKIIRAHIKNREYAVPYIDILLFPGQIGIYLFKVASADGLHVTPEEISEVLYFFRSRGNLILVDGKKYAVEDYLCEFLMSAVRLSPQWDRFSPQLKSYTMINVNVEGTITKAHDILLFELANGIPVSSFRNSPRAPSEVFFEKTFDSNCLSIFSNWKAISLFDSFTRLSIGSPDPFGTWEFDYLNIYLLSLYTKYQLYFFNSQLTNVIKVSKQAYSLKTRFIEFVNDHNHAYISYKFLPNELYGLMRSSLAIQKEIDQVELKSTRLGEAYSELKSRQLNMLILVLSTLSVISVLTDVSEWLSKMGLSETLIYSLPFASLVVGVPVLIYFLARLFRR